MDTLVRDRIEQVARICHAANRAYCESIGDKSQLEWDEAPNWQKESAINGVKFHLTQLSAGITPKPSASHESWLKEKESEGWVYGAEKNPSLKQHPCFVPYDQLPLDQKMKDYIFSGIVAAFWKAYQDEDAKLAAA